MMLIDIQVALGGELERKACVLGQLLDHVIKKSDAGGGFHGMLGIQVHAHLDPGLLGFAQDLRAPREQRLNYRRPGLCLAPVTAGSRSVLRSPMTTLASRSRPCSHR